VRHAMDHQSAALCRIGRCDDLEVGYVLNPSLTGRRKADIGDDRVVRTARIDGAKCPPLVDRIGRRGAGSRGSQDDRRKVDGRCLIDDDPLDCSMTERTTADERTEPESRYEIQAPLVSLRIHLQFPPLVNWVASQ